MQQVIGIDIGTYSVKATILDASQKLEIVVVDEERVLSPVETSPPPVPAQESEADEGTPAEQDAQEHAQESTEPTDDGPLWLSALGRLVARLELSKAESIVITMPDDMAMTVHLTELPFADRNKLKDILPIELDSKLPLDIEDITYDFRILSQPTDEEHEAVVAFARNRDLANVLELFKRADCDPRLILVPEWALEFAMLAMLNTNDEETYALLDMGHQHTRVLVMQGKRPIMARSIQRGGLHITQTLAQLFQIDEDQAERIKIQRGAIYKAGETQDPGLDAMSKGITRALAHSVRDLRRTFQSLYAKQRIRLDRIYLGGGSSHITNLTRHLQDEFSVPVEMLPVDGMNISSDLNLLPAQQRQHILGYGLAMALGFEGNKEKRNDLRQGEFIYRGRSSYVRKKVIQYGFAAAILLVLLGAALIMQQRELDAQRKAMRAAVGKETKKLFGSSVYSKSTIKKALESEQQESKSLAPKMSAYKLMYEIVSRIDKNMTLTLTRIEVDANRNLIQIYGSTNNAQSVDKLVTDLQTGLKCIKDIRKDRLKVQSETKATFELQITSACS